MSLSNFYRKDRIRNAFGTGKTIKNLNDAKRFLNLFHEFGMSTWDDSIPVSRIWFREANSEGRCTYDDPNDGICGTSPSEVARYIYDNRKYVNSMLNGSDKAAWIISESETILKEEVE